MKKVFFSILAVILTLSLISCGPAATVTTTQTETETQTVTDTLTQEVTHTHTLTQQLTTQYGQYLKSDKLYNYYPDVDDETLATLVNGNNEFAFDLYRQLVSTQDGNLFYSPYSISLALAMTYAGANGQTKEQMADVLNFLLEDEELHAAFNKLNIEFDSRDETQGDINWEGYTLNIINAIWAQKDWDFMSEFLDVMAGNYDAGIRLLDFWGNRQEAVEIINAWISEQTEGKIEDILDESDIPLETIIVLTNAIYFSANWRIQFDQEDTYDDAFYLPDGSEITVPMMHQTDYFYYTVGDGYQSIDLKYDNGDLSMIAILPDADNFEDFESSLSSELVDEIIDSMEHDQVVLTMPRFDFESDFSLKEVLETMGMTDAFDDGKADFSGITEEAIWLSDVIHQATITVDEEGTEAAAASCVIAVLGMSEDPPEINLDHPFIFLIRDNVTGTILFAGRVMNPAT